MPGVRPRGFRFGDSAEQLAEFILGTMAFITPVPRQEDVGHDFYCVLTEPAGNLLRTGPFFTVQVKSKHESISYEKEHEISWIKTQDNPFFICVVDRQNLNIELYSTWNMLNGFLFRGAKKIVLVLGGADDEYKEVETREDKTEQVIFLGKPILRVSAQDVMDEKQAHALAAILRQWVEMDRENIVNRQAGMYWVVGPIQYKTNKPLDETTEWRTSFFWNPKNLERCLINFGRAATALRLVTRKALGSSGEEHSAWILKIENLENTLRSHSEFLEPLAKTALAEEVGLDLT